MLLANSIECRLMRRKEVENIAYRAARGIMTREEEKLDLAYRKLLEGVVHAIQLVLRLVYRVSLEGKIYYRFRELLFSGLRYLEPMV